MISLPRAEGWDQMSLSSPVTISKQKQEEEFHCEKPFPLNFSPCKCQNSVLIIVSVPQLTHMNTKTHANDTSNSFAPTSLIQQQHLL